MVQTLFGTDNSTKDKKVETIIDHAKQLQLSVEEQIQSWLHSVVVRGTVYRPILDSKTKVRTLKQVSTHSLTTQTHITFPIVIGYFKSL